MLLAEVKQAFINYLNQKNLRIKDIKKVFYGAFLETFRNFKMNYIETKDEKHRNNYFLYLSNFFLSFSIFFLRRPDALVNPQLWAEDGIIFLRDQWIAGFPDSIAILYAGYIHFIPRLVAFIADFFPYELIPFVFNFCAILLASLSVSIFSLTNFRYILKSDFLRTIVIFLICFVPVGYETINNITNVHFFLAFGVFLIALIGGKIDNWTYFFIFPYVLMSLMSAPLAICYVPLYLIRPILCKYDRYRWIFLSLFVFGVIYGLLMFYIGSKNSVPTIDWIFLTNPLNIERLIRVTLSSFLFNDNYFAFITYFRYLWIFELFLLFYLVKKFKMHGVQITVLMTFFLLSMLFPVLLRGGLYLTEVQQTQVLLLNGSKDYLYFANVFNLMISRYGVVPYFIFCILTFVILFENIDWRWKYFFPLIATVLYIFMIRNFIFIKPFENLNWSEYSDLVKNKQEVLIPINPRNYSIQMKKEDWR